jgi:hypothetical protein
MMGDDTLQGMGRFLLAGLVSMAGLCTTAEAWSDIYLIASTEASSGYILFVPFVALWLALARRQRLRVAGARPWVLGLALVSMGAILFWLGKFHLTGWELHAGAMLVLLGSVASLLGPATAKSFLPALLVLFFLIPPPLFLQHEVAMGLEEASGGLSRAALGLFLWPETPGELPHHSSQMGFCLAMLLLLLAVGYAFGKPYRLSARVLLVALSLPITILSNSVRQLLALGLTPELALPFSPALLIVLPGGVGVFVFIGLLRLMELAPFPVKRFRLAYD